jgi:cysteine desulfurase/selenocysteine lyase
MANWRSEWFDFENTAYIDTAAQGALPRVAVRAVQQALEWKKFPHQMPPETYFHLPDRVRSSLAKMIGGEAQQIAITTGTTGGLAAVARGLEWQPQDEVLIAKGEFPSHFATFLPLAAAGKLAVKVVEPRARFISADDFIEQIGPRTRLVSTSLVRFDTGSRLDAVRVARACHQAGALLLLDAAQCVGAMPINVAELEADFVAASGYKWLLGPYGTGFFWARTELIEQMRVGPFYWMALEDAAKFHTLSAGEFRLAKGARRWDSPETASFLNLAAVDASLEFLLRVGVETVWEHNRELIAELVERLPLDRFVLASPSDPDERGPYICIVARKQEKTAAVFEQLRQAGVIVSLREGALRIAPHLYNSGRDLDRLLSLLAM